MDHRETRFSSVGRRIGGKVNHKQKVVLVVVSVVIAAMLVFPPFHLKGGGYTRNMGYGFLLSPPAQGSGSVDTAMLTEQWLGVLVIGGIAFFILNDG